MKKMIRAEGETSKSADQIIDTERAKISNFPDPKKIQKNTGKREKMKPSRRLQEAIREDFLQNFCGDGEEEGGREGAREERESAREREREKEGGVDTGCDRWTSTGQR
jgi:hypothetical protein